MKKWEQGFDTANKFPVFGLGFDAWAPYYSAHYEKEHGSSVLVHNVFIQCLSELGYVGLLVFISMISCCVLLGRKTRKNLEGISDRFLFYISYGFDFALIGFLVSSSFITVLYYPYFWIHCAFVAAMYNVSRSEKLKHLALSRKHLSLSS